MEIWIFFTLFAAFVQNLRFIVQKNMTISGFSAPATTFARFIYAAPLSVIIASLWVVASGEMPKIRLVEFLFWGMFGGLAQTLATILVVALFKIRNFSVGIAFKNTEVILSALVGFLILKEAISWGAALAIVGGFFGVMLLSDKSTAKGGRALWQSLSGKAVTYGLGSGLFFALCAVGYRATTLAVESDDFILRALLSVAIANCFQAAILWGWLSCKKPGEAPAIIRAWRFSLTTSSLSLAGSFGWFSAFALKPVAYVATVGQIGLIFALFSSVFIFKETPTGREIWGSLILTLSIVILIILA